VQIELIVPSFFNLFFIIIVYIKPRPVCLILISSSLLGYPNSVDKNYFWCRILLASSKYSFSVTFTGMMEFQNSQIAILRIIVSISNPIAIPVRCFINKLLCQLCLVQNCFSKIFDKGFILIIFIHFRHIKVIIHDRLHRF
jgi:hypothetical protein